MSIVCVQKSIALIRYKFVTHQINNLDVKEAFYKRFVADNLRYSTEQKPVKLAYFEEESVSLNPDTTTCNLFEIQTFHVCIYTTNNMFNVLSYFPLVRHKPLV
jgi:hypothetical protein